MARAGGKNHPDPLPGILPTIIIMLVLCVMGNILNVGFEKIILLYNES